MSETSRLQEWINNNTPSKDMYFYNPFFTQVMFVRDEVAGLLASSFKEYEDLVDVAGTHTSKSVTCPVYFIKIPNQDVEIWMRYNFYNWNISINSDKEIVGEFLDTFNPKDNRYAFCEGMTEHKYDTYDNNKKRFTIEVGSHYECYTFFKALKKILNITLAKG